MTTLPLCRSNDPLTSFQAADSATILIAAHHRQIIATLRLHGPNGVDRIAELADLEPHAVGKRMKALQEDGAAVLTGKTVKGYSGRNQREWAAK